jgi:TATA-box binding protein (TBP) (component of TFIID and TFIIIB)
MLMSSSPPDLEGRGLNNFLTFPSSAFPGVIYVLKSVELPGLIFPGGKKGLRNY